MNTPNTPPTSPLCRCGDAEHEHCWTPIYWAKISGSVNMANTDWGPGSCWCGCPEYRPAETRDTLTHP